jgi:NTE family protein
MSRSDIIEEEQSVFENKRVSVVLGGGGMKGLAHIGVLKALQKMGVEPDEYVGTSVGAFIAAMAAGGMTPAQIEEVGRSTRREDLLDYNWAGLLWRRSRARSIYRGKALHDYVRRILLEDRFDHLRRPLYVTAVNIDTGQEVVWGMPGFTELPVHDAVVSSCSIPGIYPPKRINRYHFVDGGVADTLPIKVAVYTKADLIVAVFLDSINGVEPNGASPVPQGAASILYQSQGIISRTMLQLTLRRYAGAPIELIRLNVAGYGLFDCARTAELIELGEREAKKVLRSWPALPENRTTEQPDNPTTG